MNKVLVTTSSFAKNSSLPMEILKDFEVILNPYKRKLTEDEVLSLLLEHRPVAILAGVEPLTANVIEKSADFLKIISRCGIGMDSVDIESAKTYGIKVFNTPDAPTKPVAELTLGLILDVLRGISKSDKSIRNNQWERPMGNLLYGKTVGIIGCGRIGSYVARLCEAFGAKIIGYDPFISEHKTLELKEKDFIIKNSDIISLHIPFCEANRNFISANEINNMKSEAILINASRGGLVDEDALYQALVSNKIKAAALDCFEKEPYEGKLKELDNVVLTAHIGSYANEARLEQEISAAKNIVENL